MSVRRYTTISGLSSTRRMPRLGKFRLGKKAKKAEPDSRCKHTADKMCQFCSYPVKTDHFVVPPQVTAAKNPDGTPVYGMEPKELDIMLHTDDMSQVFPQALELYVASGLKCTGDGITAREKNDKGEWIDRQCPCDRLHKRGGCSEKAHLSVILYKVATNGVFSIDTGSINSMIDLNSGFDLISTMFRSLGGTIKMKPLVLTVKPRTLDVEGKKTTVYVMGVEWRGTLMQAKQLVDEERGGIPVTYVAEKPDMKGFPPSGVDDDGVDLVMTITDMIAKCDNPVQWNSVKSQLIEIKDRLSTDDYEALATKLKERKQVLLDSK